jgi:predicted signal transduction protein with EAL and GGDEF domain
MLAAPKPFAKLASFTAAFVTGPLRRHEAALVFGLAAVAAVWLTYFDAAGRLLAFAAVHERSALADLWLVLSLFGAALIVVVHRRNRRLQDENRARQAAEHDSWKLARHDTLTGLPNRSYFAEMVTAALLRVNDSDTRAAVLMFDLTGFKAVNEI